MCIQQLRACLEKTGLSDDIKCEVVLNQIWAGNTYPDSKLFSRVWEYLNPFDSALDENKLNMFFVNNL